MKPYKDKRFSIAVFDYGEYSYRENLSTITPNELRKFLQKHDLFCDESFKASAWSEIKSLQKELSELREFKKEAIKVLEMVEDNSKMPHQHSDYYTRLCCLSEMAREFLEKHKGFV